MQKKTRLSKAAIVSYAVVAIAFLLFFLYIALFEDVSVYKARSTRACTTIENYTEKKIEDSTAPAGIRKEYRFTLGNTDTSENSLGFYLVHSYAEVYFDDELMYQLVPDEKNYFYKDISSNWVIIPVYPEDTGKEVRVIVTPVYKSVVNRSIQFHLGSQLMIYLEQLKADFPQLLLSGVCILCGILITIVQLLLIISGRSRSWELFYLGNFSLLLGLWKISDTRFSPLLFTNNTLVLGYIALGLLFLAPIPFLLFFKDQFCDTKKTLLVPVSLLASCTAFLCLLCQIFRIADLKETLICCHIIMLLTIIVILHSFIWEDRHFKKPQKEHIPQYVMCFFLITGVLTDLMKFYITGTSGGIVFTISAFLVCIIVIFIQTLLNSNKRGYTDAQTGFFNRHRWNQLVRSIVPVTENVGVMILDLNGLKKCNDTMGHDVGDKMIYNFSNILRNSISHNNTICRWGGDEFAVIISDADKEKMEACHLAVLKATESHNASGEKPEIYFAAGYALSSEFPKDNLDGLLRVADKRMYHNKRKWYKEHRE